MYVLDEDIRVFNISNGGAQTYTLPFRSQIWLGRFKRDDTGAFNVTIDAYTDTIQDSDDTSEILSSFVEPTSSLIVITVHAKVVEAGRTLRVDAQDDAQVSIHIIRIPE